LREAVKELSAAACSVNPRYAVERLAERYASDHEKGIKEAEAAEMLSQACQRLTQGNDPTPITPSLLLPGLMIDRRSGQILGQRNRGEPS
jgi:hypothetical protein